MRMCSKEGYGLGLHMLPTECTTIRDRAANKHYRKPYIHAVFTLPLPLSQLVIKIMQVRNDVMINIKQVKGN